LLLWQGAYCNETPEIPDYPDKINSWRSPHKLNVSRKKDVILSWSKPSSTVKFYVLYRGKSGNRPAVLTSPSGELNQYRDNMLVGKGAYNYLIKAVYADGGESPILNMGTITID